MKGSMLSGRIPELDGIRGIAILLVILWHYGVCLVDPSSPSQIVFLFKTLFSFTWSGVDLFFVLSGFLIGGVLIDHKGSSNYFKVFYIRRICRIFPLYFLLIFFFIGIILTSASEPSQLFFSGQLPIASYLTFTQNFFMAKTQQIGANWLGVTWSICVEEQFYLILPFLIHFISFARLPYFLIFLIGSVPLIRILFHPKDPCSIFFLLHCRADALLLGVLCAYLIRKDHAKNYLVTYKRYLYYFLCGCVLVLPILGIQYNSGQSDILRSILYFLGALVYTCFLMIALVDKEGRIHRILTHRFLQFFGILAYGIYLFHQAVSAVVHDLLLNQSPSFKTPLEIIVTGIAFFLTTALAYLSWNFFEKPIVLFGHSFKYQSIEEPESRQNHTEETDVNKRSVFKFGAIFLFLFFFALFSVGIPKILKRQLNIDRQLGDIYVRLGYSNLSIDSQKAESYFLKALDLFENVSDQQIAYVNLYLLYQKTQEYEKISQILEQIVSKPLQDISWDKEYLRFYLACPKVCFRNQEKAEIFLEKILKKYASEDQWLWISFFVNTSVECQEYVYALSSISFWIQKNSALMGTENVPCSKRNFLRCGIGELK